MATTQGNKKILDQKRWEMMGPVPATVATNTQTIVSDHIKQQVLFNISSNVHYLYDPAEDGYVQLGNSTASLFGGGAGAASAWSTGNTVGTSSITATDGTTSTIDTTVPIVRNLAGWPIHILSGPNAGQTLTITSNTLSGTRTITVPTQGSAFTASTTFRLGTPRWWILYASASGMQPRVYDWATNTWTVFTATGIPASATGAVLTATPSWIGDGYMQFSTGTASSGTSTTLVDSTKAWGSGFGSTNMLANNQVRIVSGTGAGQIRNIASNTTTTLTVSSAWTTTPDNTSVYSIEPNDDYLYLQVSGSLTLYRYTISTNTWTTLSPTTARSNAPNSGMMAAWVHSHPDTTWSNENTVLQNGRFIYSLAAFGSAQVDMYDIANNTWLAGGYGYTGGGTASFVPMVDPYGSSGAPKLTMIEGRLYAVSGYWRWVRMDPALNFQDGWSTMPEVASVANQSNSAFAAYYQDGSTKIWYNYIAIQGTRILMRCMVF